MTLSQRCRKKGLRGACELAEMTNTSTMTLYNWMNNKPVLFEVVLTGAAFIKSREIENDTQG